jgi:hypothetical protein
MRWSIFFLIIVLAGCGGSLNDDQRKEMREARKSQSIQKVSDAELTEEAFTKGRLIISQVERKAGLADSLELQYQAYIRWLDPASATINEIEKQLFDAYLSSAMAGGSLSDNVQRLGNDSLIYSKPVVTELPDGSVQVKGTWNVRMAKKDLVLGMRKK